LKVSELIAFTREVSPALGRAELTHLPRVPIDIATARAQHAEYERVLGSLGCVVRRLPAGANMPDSVFVEDTAVIFDDFGIIARPGVESRRAECAEVEEALKHHRLLGHIEAPGTLDGGDVLVAGRSVFVGSSRRSNSDGIAQLRRVVEYFGYALHVVEVRGCLHLKSAVTMVSDTTVLVNRQWVPPAAFAALDTVEVHPDEPLGANLLRVKDRLVYAAAFPRTRDLLDRLGYSVATVALSEIAKAEGAVTCCSLVLESQNP
jgi:dimethylargininase